MTKKTNKKPKGKEMKKIVITLITLLPIVAYGDNMCVKDGSVLVVLDPQINGTALASDAGSKTWSTQFSYGVVSGICGCSNKYNTGTVVPDSAVVGSSWPVCKMLHPIESEWIALQHSPSGYSCSSQCASSCSSFVGNTRALRTGMFSNIVE